MPWRGGSWDLEPAASLDTLWDGLGSRPDSTRREFPGSSRSIQESCHKSRALAQRGAGGRMKLCQVVPPLLLGLGLGLARATTPAPHGSTSGLAGSFPTSLPGLWNVSYQDVVVATVELLNSRGISPYVLRLQELQPQPGWLRDLRSHQDLSFTLEETTCRAPGTATAACQSRWWGGVTRCQGSVFLEEQQPMVQLSCEKVPIVLGGTRRSHLKGLLSRIRSGLGRFFQCGKIWIRDKLHLDRPQP